MGLLINVIDELIYYALLGGSFLSGNFNIEKTYVDGERVFKVSLKSYLRDGIAIDGEISVSVFNKRKLWSLLSPNPPEEQIFLKTGVGAKQLLLDRDNIVSSSIGQVTIVDGKSSKYNNFEMISIVSFNDAKDAIMFKIKDN